MEYFDITASAAAASAFTGLLAAIVLAVTVQIAVTVTDRSRERSLIGAPFVLVTLLVAAYFFVLIAGEPPAAALLSPPDEISDTTLTELEFQVRRSSYLFAIAGTVLATGAVLAVYVIGLVIVDNGEGDLATDPARAGFVLGAVAAGSLLVFGFMDIETAVTGSPPNGVWWYVRVFALAIPALVATEKEGWHGGKANPNSFVVVGVVLIGGPVALFIWATVATSFADLPHVGFITFIGSLYFGTFIAIAGWHLWSPPPSKPPPRARSVVVVCRPPRAVDSSDAAAPLKADSNV